MNGQTCPTGRIERLLVATDGTEESRNAVAVGLELAKACSCKLELMAVAVVLTNLEYDSAMPWVIEGAEKDMQQKLEAVRAMVKETGIDCEIIVHRGEDPSVEIVAEAVKYKADMIVMGTHGRTGIKRFVMGSVAGNVIGHAPCKVLVVPTGAKIDYRNVLVAIDGSIHSDAAVSEALTIAQRCDSSLTILSVASSDEEVRTAEDSVKRAMEVADREGVRKEGMVLRGEADEAIVKMAGQTSAGLIVMGSHGKTGLMSLLMGSVTERVLGHGNTAVLVAKVQ
jgi:nucleotide-binding universal stress UspA family protein